MYGYQPDLEHVFSYSATLHAPFEVLGETPAGLRINAYVSGGEISGPRLRGRVRPVGADWLTLRRDGIGVLDVRATLETDDGALLYLEYGGVLDLGEDGYQRMLAGNPPARAPIRAAPRVLTAPAVAQHRRGGFRRLDGLLRRLRDALRGDQSARP
jgi:hypothetical protein